MKKIQVLAVSFILLFSLSFSDNFVFSTVVEKDSPNFISLQNTAAEIFKRLGSHTVELVSLPGERAINDAAAGVYDGDFSRLKGIVKNYPNLIEIPAPLSKIRTSVYTTNPDIEIVSVDTLKNYSVIIVRGSKAIEQLLKNIEPPKINIPNSNEAALKMLILKRADILIGTDILIDAEIETSKIQGIIKLEKPLMENSVHILINKKHAALVPAISEVIKTMTKEGTLYKLMPQ